MYIVDGYEAICMYISLAVVGLVTLLTVIPMILRRVNKMTDLGRVNTENCGNCEYHKKDEDGNWVCDNPVSDDYGLDTGYEDICEDYERRER